MYDIKECFFCKKPIYFKKGRFDTQKQKSSQYYHKKCFKKIMEVYAKQGRVEEEPKTFEIIREK